jgi:hypothetical protein
MKQSIASDALQAFASFKSWDTSLRNCLSHLQGTIIQIRFTKVKKGVSETLLIKFNDHSRVKLTKFIPFKGEVRVSIKRDD